MTSRSLPALLGLGFVMWLLSPGCTVATPATQQERPLWQRIDEPAVTTCAPCHMEVYKEWSESLHHRAWVNPNIVRATNNFEKKVCRSCHSPMPVLPRGLERRPKYRDVNQGDGVHCLSCHGLEDGVAATRTIPDAPCRPRYEPRLMQAELCYPCHEPTHQAFSEYYKSDAYAVGVRCVDCHMQPASGRRGRSHGPHGGMNAGFVKRAIAWQCTIENGKLRIQVRNRCGHKFPGEIPSRSFHLEVRIGDTEPTYTVLRRPFKGEERRDNRLAPDESRTFEYPVGNDTDSVTVRFLFKPLPLMPVAEAFEIGKWRSKR